jgi:hypothetical protein
LLQGRVIIPEAEADESSRGDGGKYWRPQTHQREGQVITSPYPIQIYTSPRFRKMVCNLGLCR